MVQDLATQWLQSYPCKTKSSQGTGKSLRKFLELSEKPKVIYTDNSLEFGKSCEELSWNHRASAPIDPRRMDLLREQYAESRKELMQVVLQAGLDENWRADSMECYSKSSRLFLGWENTI